MSFDPGLWPECWVVQTIANVSTKLCFCLLHRRKIFLILVGCRTEVPDNYCNPPILMPTLNECFLIGRNSDGMSIFSTLLHFYWSRIVPLGPFDGRVSVVVGEFCMTPNQNQKKKSSYARDRSITLCWHSLWSGWLNTLAKALGRNSLVFDSNLVANVHDINWSTFFGMVLSLPLFPPSILSSSTQWPSPLQLTSLLEPLAWVRLHVAHILD